MQASRRSSLAALTAARSHDSLLVIHAYCDSNEDACPAREVDVDVKDHDGSLLALVRRRGLLCPLCGVPLKVHSVESFRDRALNEESVHAG